MGRSVSGRSFAPAKKGALESVKPSAVRERSGWYWSMVRVTRWEISAGKCHSGRIYVCESHACRSQSRQTERPSLPEGETRDRRTRLRFRPAARATGQARHDLIVPCRINRIRQYFDDGRKLRRYKRRWIVGRINVWLGQFRRLLVRHEFLLSTYRAFLLSRLPLITLRRCFFKHALVI